MNSHQRRIKRRKHQRFVKLLKQLYTDINLENLIPQGALILGDLGSNQGHPA